MTVPKYKRILLKLSGEALMGNDAYGINPQTIAAIVGEIKAVADMGVEIGVVIGGNPEKIGNRVYANIIGNGNEASGDGYRYRGRGYIQLTGKSNYQAFSDFIGEDCVANADWVATKYPLASAAHYFNGNKIWTTCDKGSTAATIKAVTLKVNKAALGLDERTAFFNKFWALLSKAV